MLKLDQKVALVSLFIAFCYVEPVSTSAQNALMAFNRLIVRGYEVWRKCCFHDLMLYPLRISNFEAFQDAQKRERKRLEVVSLVNKDQQEDTMPNGVITFGQEPAHLSLSGVFTSEYGNQAEEAMRTLALRLVQEKPNQEQSGSEQNLIIDLQALIRMDTLGAWLINKLAHGAGELGIQTDIINSTEEQKILLKETTYKDFFENDPPRYSGIKFWAQDLVTDIGKGVYGAFYDFVMGISFLGEVTVSLVRGAKRRGGLRFPSVINQMQYIAWQGVPIVSLISFVVGGIIAQQGIFQLSYFGATAFAVDLIGILTLRELAVLLTAIMVAGRSGSAFTAEIGSMKMNEEIDALRVMGMNPMSVLILPRLIALIVSLPLLTFVASMASIFGGGLVCWIYGNISPDVFLGRLQASIGFNTFAVGLIKAPFMAFVIGIIATLEGMAVQGSSESLGVHVTSSVVKSIFMVIVMDGLFAVFFAAIEY